MSVLRAPELLRFTYAPVGDAPDDPLFVPAVIVEPRGQLVLHREGCDHVSEVVGVVVLQHDVDVAASGHHSPSIAGRAMKSAELSSPRS